MDRVKYYLAAMWRLLRSRSFSFVVLASFASLTAMWLVPFQLTGLQDASINKIASEWLPFRIVYALVLVTTLLCTLYRVRRDWRKATRWGQLADTTASRSPAFTSPLGLGDAAGRLEAAGFDVETTPGTLVAVRRPWAPLGGSVMHFAVIGLAAGLALHSVTYASTTFRLIEGEALSGAGTVGLPPAEAELRRLVSDAELTRIDPRYHKDVLLFSKLEAEWKRADGGKQRFSLAQPLWVDPFTHVSIQDFGFAPHLVLTDPNRGKLDDTIPAMNLFPPGTQDSVTLPGSALDVSAIILPDYGVRAGRDVSLSYNLSNPRVVLTVSNQAGSRAVVARGIAAVGQPVKVVLPSGVVQTLTVSEIRRYGSFRISRSYGIPLLVISGALLLMGLAMRVFGRRLDIVAWLEADGLAVDAYADMEGRTVGVRAARKLLVDESEVSSS